MNKPIQYGSKTPREMCPWYDLAEPNSPVRAIRDYHKPRIKQPETKVGCFSRPTPVLVKGRPLYGDFYMILQPGTSTQGDWTEEVQRLAYALGHQLECGDNTVRFFEDAPTKEFRAVVSAEALGIEPTSALPTVYEKMVQMIAYALDLRSARQDVYHPHYCMYEPDEEVWEEVTEEFCVEVCRTESQVSGAVTTRRYKTDLLEWDPWDGGYWYFTPKDVLSVLKRYNGEGYMNGLDYLRSVYSEALKAVSQMDPAGAATSSSMATPSQWKRHWNHRSRVTPAPENEM